MYILEYHIPLLTLVLVGVRVYVVVRIRRDEHLYSVYTPVNILYIRDMRYFSESIECTVQNYTLFWSTGVRRDCTMYCQRVISGTTRTLCRFVHNYYKLYEKMHRLSLDVVVLEVSMLLAETIKMSALMSPLKWLRRSYFCSRQTFRASHIGIVLQDTPASITQLYSSPSTWKGWLRCWHTCSQRTGSLKSYT